MEIFNTKTVFRFEMKTILIIISDGVSLKNFAYTNFVELAKKNNLNLVFFNTTIFDLTDLGLIEIKFQNPKTHWFSNILKSVKKNLELRNFSNITNDKIYYSYQFPLNYNGLKNSIKSIFVKLLYIFFVSINGLKFIKKLIDYFETKTDYYKKTLKILQDIKPDLVYCTSQRSSLSNIPLLVSKKLKIPTITFVFSWDNIPKSTMEVRADYYHVWSDHMKNELLFYYPEICSKQIIVTGTPQFEHYFNSGFSMSKYVFYNKYGLDNSKDYICFSGDDVTTSPKDQLYLRDLLIAVREINKEKSELGVIFRRCPVDFSGRFDSILEEFKDEVVEIKPIWEKIGDGWNHILPKKEDLILQKNLAEHCIMVANLGSSMVFDFITHNKPSAYFNYNYLEGTLKSGVDVYNYVHFRSMPDNVPVIWFNNPNDIKSNLKYNKDILENALIWFKSINKFPPEQASLRIINHILSL